MANHSRHILLATAFVAAHAPVSTAQAKPVQLAIQPVEGQATSMTHGVQIVVSHTPQTEVRMMTSEPSESGRFSLAFMFVNRSAAAINIGPEVITATTVSLVSHDQLLEEQRRREGRKKFGHFLYTLGNAMSAANAGNSYSSYNYSGFTSGGGYYSGVGTVSVYNPYAAQRAQEWAYAANEAHSERMYQSFSIDRNAIGANLRTTTLMPWQQIQTVLTFNVPKALRNARTSTPFTITVRMGSETHVLNGFVGPVGTLPVIAPSPSATLEALARTSAPSPAQAPALTSPEPRADLAQLGGQRPATTLGASPALANGRAGAKSQSVAATANIEAYARGEYAGQPDKLGVLAKQGFAPAQNDLATLYLNGSGVERNYTEAFRLYRLAAEQNMRDAQSNLAWMYETGQGTAKNLPMAKRYYRRAADAGNELAQAKLNDLEVRM